MQARKVVGPDGFLYPEGTTFSNTPLAPEEIASDENLSFLALENQLRAAHDEADDNVMTADKLRKKIPGMAHGVPFVEGYEWREEDEELLRDAQT